MLNILYVEDDANSRVVFQMLERMNPNFMNLVMFQDSEHFEQRLLALNPAPDIILLDIHVLPYNGFEMLKMIRCWPQFGAVSVIALTASVMNEEVETLKTAGFQGVLSKPIDLDTCVSLIARMHEGENIWYVW